MVAGGIMIALAFALGGIYVYEDQYEGTLGWALFQIGGPSAFALMVPFLSAFIAYYNQSAEPIQWSYTVEKLKEKLGAN